MLRRHTDHVSVVGVLVLLLALAAAVNAWPQASPNPPGQNKPEPAPQWLVYHFLFRQVIELDRKADEMDRQGQSGAGLRNYFAGKAKLTADEAQTLKAVAAKCEQRVQALDAAAERVIAAARAHWPTDRSTPRPPAPPELYAMQEQRDKVIQDSLDALKKALGEQSFNKLDQYVENEFANKVHVAAIGEPPPQLPPKGKP
jgi:hypothetical protein